MIVTGLYPMDTYFHCAIYAARTDVNCIIHTHAAYMTALALTGKDIPYIQYAVKLQLGSKEEICDFYPPDDKRMIKEIIEKLGQNNAVLLKNHGGIAVGKTVKSSLENIVYLEELSQSYVHALAIGKVETIG